MRDFLFAGLLWIVLIIVDTAGQLAFKIGSQDIGGVNGWMWIGKILASPWVAVGILCYLGSFVTWMSILQRSDLSAAFPMTAISYVTVLLASHFLLGEVISTIRWVGVTSIFLGFVSILVKKTW